jgi:hypothetical protein
LRRRRPARLATDMAEKRRLEEGREEDRHSQHR